MQKWAKIFMESSKSVRGTEARAKIFGGLSDSLLEELHREVGHTDPILNRAEKERAESLLLAANFDPDGKYSENFDPFQSVRTEEDVYYMCDQVLDIFVKQGQDESHNTDLQKYAGFILGTRRKNDEAKVKIQTES